MTNIEDKVKRPVKYLTALTQRYPGLWKLVDQARAKRDLVAKHCAWPSWCYLSVPVAIGILKPQDDTLESKAEPFRVAALASWRLAKDIYIFDDTVLEELWNTPIVGNIPIDILHRLPTLCAYVAFPETRSLGYGGKCYGFFVHLNYFSMPMLSLTLDFGLVDRIAGDYIPLMPYYLQLHEGRDLLQCLTIMDEASRRHFAAKGGLPEEFQSEDALKAIAPKAVKGVVEPLLSLTLYLCSTSAEIRQRDPFRGLRRDHYTKKTRKGVRTFVPMEPQVWEVAYRIGATLRAATAAASQRSDGDGTGTHASPRPHIRRAHWHSYWTGPKAKVGDLPVPDREIVLKWIPPIPVAMGPDSESIPTVHRVTK